MEQWDDISRLLTESMNWISQTRRIEHDWKIHSLEQQITKTEAGNHFENIVEKCAVVFYNLYIRKEGSQHSAVLFCSANDRSFGTLLFISVFHLLFRNLLEKPKTNCVSLKIFYTANNTL